jgi:hypothetical protein
MIDIPDRDEMDEHEIVEAWPQGPTIIGHRSLRFEARRDRLRSSDGSPDYPDALY